MAKKKEIPTGKEVHLSPEQCETFYKLINTVGPKNAGGLAYAMNLADLIKSVGSARQEGKLDAREKFGRRYTRAKAGKDGLAEREAIETELDKWLKDNKLTSECFPSSPKTIAITIPAESDTVILHALLFHSRRLMGGGLVQIMEFCDKFELRTEFIKEAAKIDEEDKKAEAKKNES